MVHKLTLRFRLFQLTILFGNFFPYFSVYGTIENRGETENIFGRLGKLYFHKMVSIILIPLKIKEH
jgi:hypothetical protein